MIMRGRIRLHTIISIFISIILLCIIPGLGVLSLSLFKTRIIESFADSRKDTLFQISESVTEYCNKIELLSSAYAGIAYIQDQADLSKQEINNTTFKENIDSIKKDIDDSFFFPEIEYELQILYTNGLSYSSNADHLKTLLELPEKSWFYRARKGGEESVWQSNIPAKSESKKTNFISLVKFLKGENSSTAGAILINLDERQLYQEYSRIIGFQSTIYIVALNGQIVSHPILSMVGRFFYDMEIFDAFFQEKDWAQILKSEEEYLFSRFPSNNNPWIVVEEIPMAVIMDPLFDITKTIYFLTVLLLFLSIIIAIFFSKWVSAPFEQLSDTMELAGDGDLTVSFKKTGCRESFQMAESSQDFVGRIQSLIKEVQTIQQEKQNSELEFLQMQINPHFIYNTLFSIRCMVDIGMTDKAGKMLNRFSNMLQKVLRIKSPMISILDNINYLEDYSFILAQRFGTLSLEYEVEKGIENEKILKFILQPLVENSIFHGFADNFGQDSRIIISFHTVGADKIKIQVVDNGCGMPPEVLTETMNPTEKRREDHIGLLNVKTKLELYYEGNARLAINSKEGEGTRISIIVPRSVDGN